MKIISVEDKRGNIYSVGQDYEYDYALDKEDSRIDKIEFIDAANPHTYVKLVLLNGDEVDILDYSKIVRSK